MIPNFDSVEKIKRFRPFGNRANRLAALNAAIRRLEIFYEAGDIDRKDFMDIRARLLLLRSEEGVRWQRESNREIQSTTLSARPG